MVIVCMYGYVCICIQYVWRCRPSMSNVHACISWWKLQLLWMGLLTISNNGHVRLTMSCVLKIWLSRHVSLRFDYVFTTCIFVFRDTSVTDGSQLSGGRSLWRFMSLRSSCQLDKYCPSQFTDSQQVKDAAMFKLECLACLRKQSEKCLGTNCEKS